MNGKSVCAWILVKSSHIRMFTFRAFGLIISVLADQKSFERYIFRKGFISFFFSIRIFSHKAPHALADAVRPHVLN